MANPIDSYNASVGIIWDATGIKVKLGIEANQQLSNLGVRYSAGLIYHQKNFLSAGVNIDVNHRFGSLATAYGMGVTYHSNFFKTKKKGVELRGSLMAGYHFNENSELSLGTNKWWGFGQLDEFNQRTGIASYRYKDFRFSYENDGAPFNNTLGDGNDRYRTAAASIEYKDLSVDMNLFTGLRDKQSFKTEKGLPGGKKGIPMGRGKYGEYYHHGFVDEKGPRYRYGGIVINYQGLYCGYESEWIRHAFQNVFAHHILKPQRQFEMLNGDLNYIVQPKVFKTKFTLW